MSIENDLEFNFYRLYVKSKNLTPIPKKLRAYPSLQDLLYISQVPTLFAVTNKHEKLFSIFCFYEPDPCYFQREENSLAAQFPALLLHLSDSYGNKWPSSLA